MTKRGSDEVAPIAKKTRFTFRVISGGQTGADRAALEAARACGVETGGYAPPRFMTAAGPDISLKHDFGLTAIERQISLAQAYALRSRVNVDVSDVTIAFRLRASIGTDKTIGYCLTGKWKSMVGRARPALTRHRNVLVLPDLTDEDVCIAKITEFLRSTRPNVINVCGHRSDEIADMVGYTSAVRRILEKVFAALEEK